MRLSKKGSLYLFPGAQKILPFLPRTDRASVGAVLPTPESVTSDYHR